MSNAQPTTPLSANSSHQTSAITLAAMVFAGCFAAWTLASVIGLQIKDELDLTQTQFGLLVGCPLLSGALLRLPLGLLAERWCSRNLMLALLLFVSLPLALMGQATEFWQFLVLGFAVGAAGAMFSVGIYFVSSRASASQQGLAMGIFGSGHIGAAITNLVVPMIILAYGWRSVPGVYAAVLVVLGLLFWLLTRADGDLHQHQHQNRHQATDAQNMTVKEQLKPLLDARVWRFGLYYLFMFGGYISLVLWLPGYYMAHYGLDLQHASLMTMIFTLSGALSWVSGGWFADHFGARQVNWGAFWVCLISLFFLSYPPTSMTIHGTNGDLSFVINMPIWLFSSLIFVMGIAMGFGKAGVMRVVFDYYPDRMGVVAGWVGMVGALGGFVLLVLFGILADLMGVRSACFMLLYGLLVVCMGVMYYGVSQEQKRTRLQEAIRTNFLQAKD